MPYQFYTLVLLLSFSIQSQAQNFIDNISIKGGFLFDEHEYFEELSEEQQEGYKKRNYKGFNYLSIGLNGEKRDKVYGLELEISGFEIDPEPRIINHSLDLSVMFGVTIIPELYRLKRQLNLFAYYGKSMVNYKSYQLIAAPIVGFSYVWERDRWTRDDYFGIRTSTISLGLGLKLQNQFWLTEKFGVNIGSRFFLLDAFLEYDTTENPTLSRRQRTQSSFGIDLIRNELLLQFGINFKI